MGVVTTIHHHLSTNEHLWEILDQQHSVPPSSKPDVGKETKHKTIMFDALMLKLV